MGPRYEPILEYFCFLMKWNFAYPVELDWWNLPHITSQYNCCHIGKIIQASYLLGGNVDVWYRFLA